MHIIVDFTSPCTLHTQNLNWRIMAELENVEKETT